MQELITAQLQYVVKDESRIRHSVVPETMYSLTVLYVANGDYLYQSASCKAMGFAPEYLEW